MSQSDATNGPENETIGFGESVASIVSVNSLLEQSGIVPFTGLTNKQDVAYPDAVNPKGHRFSDDPEALESVIARLPKAETERLWSDNPFVKANGEVRTEKVRETDGIPLEDLERQTGASIEQMASAADSDPLVKVENHRDIIDPRRMALNALGFNCQYRWQIASDSYDPGDPQLFFEPMIDAFRKRDATEPFGWAHFRDWGGVVKMSIVFPSLKKEIKTAETEDQPDVDGIVEVDEYEGIDEADGDSVTLYHGYQMGYDYRGAQRVWAKPLIYVPSVDLTIPGVGTRYGRKHVGDLTDDAYERENGRLPITDWHDDIYSAVKKHARAVNKAVVQARQYALDFKADNIPFGVEEFYQLLNENISQTVAESAADRARALADPSHQPSLWNLQLSLKIALLDDYQGSKASDGFQRQQETAGELLRKPKTMIRLAIRQWEREQEKKTDGEDTSAQVAPDQETLFDSEGALEDMEALERRSEDELGHGEASEMQEHVQEQLGDF